MPLDRATAYAAEDADVTLRLRHALRPRLRATHSLALYEQIDRRLSGVLLEMERAGIKVDAADLRAMSKDFEQRMVVMEQDIHRLAGAPFNVGSPAQLGEVLFDGMGLPGGKRMKTGAYATDADGVGGRSPTQGHDLPARVLDWRQLAKLKSTYADALVRGDQPGDRPRPHLLRAGRPPPPAGCPRPTPTSRTSRSAPRRAAGSAAPSSPSQAMSCSPPIIPRSSCAWSPTSPTSPR